MATTIGSERRSEDPLIDLSCASLQECPNIRAIENNGLIDTASAISKVLASLEGLPSTPPSLYIDLEGEDLSRHGSVSILQLHVLPTKQTHLIDIKTLGHDAFLTPSPRGRTFKEVLESEHIAKVFFDVRHDSDALYSHFQIQLGGVQDLQLMELATRPRGCKNFIYGLRKCIENDAPLTLAEKVSWKADKEKGVRLFAPEHGGSYQVFSERPLREEIRDYCIQDAKYLPRLWSHYDGKLTPTWKTKVREVSKDRVAESQAPNFNGKGRHMAIAPAAWRRL